MTTKPTSKELRLKIPLLRLALAIKRRVDSLIVFEKMRTELRRELRDAVSKERQEGQGR